MARNSSQRQKIEAILLEEMKIAYRRHEAGECTADEYLAALRHFADFVVGGQVPEHLADSMNPSEG